MCAKLYSEIAPMYMKVHAYVRAKLQKYYKENYPEFEFPTDGTIPAHLLGKTTMLVFFFFFKTSVLPIEQMVYYQRFKYFTKFLNTTQELILW